MGRVLKALPPDALSVEAVGAADVAAHRRLALLLRSGKGRGRAPHLGAKTSEDRLGLLSPLPELLFMFHPKGRKSAPAASRNGQVDR